MVVQNYKTSPRGVRGWRAQHPRRTVKEAVFGTEIFLAMHKLQKNVKRLHLLFYFPKYALHHKKRKTNGLKFPKYLKPSSNELHPDIKRKTRSHNSDFTDVHTTHCFPYFGLGFLFLATQHTNL